jgi:predicted ArsR family transcriptional regulator
MNDVADNPIHWSWRAILSDPVRLDIVTALCVLRTVTLADLGARCHTSDAAIRRHLDALEALGLVRAQAAQRDGMTPGRPPRRFVLAADATTQIRALLDLLSHPLGPTPAPEPQRPAAR